MTTKSRLALLSTLAATPVFAAPFLAIGDNAELFLTARTEARFEDNLTYGSGSVASPVVDDTIFEFVPGLELTFGKSSLTKGSIIFQERLTAYQDNSQLNEALANFIATSSYEGAKVRVDLNASFKEKFQATRDLAGSAGLVRSDVYAAGGNTEASITEKSKIGVGLQYSATEYVETFKDLLVDRESYTVPVNYYFAVQPKLDLSMGVQYRALQIDRADSDFEDIYVNVGARGEFTPKLLGSFSVGYNSRSGDAANSDTDGVGVQAGLTYVYTLKTQFTLDLSNDFGAASTGLGQEIASIALGVRSSISEDLRAFASVGYDQTEFQGQDREDTFISARVGLTYVLNQYLSLDASYSHYDNASDGPQGNADFDANIVSIGASLRY